MNDNVFVLIDFSGYERNSAILTGKRAEHTAALWAVSPQPTWGEKSGTTPWLIGGNFLDNARLVGDRVDSFIFFGTLKPATCEPGSRPAPRPGLCESSR